MILGRSSADRPDLLPRRCLGEGGCIILCSPEPPEQIQRSPHRAAFLSRRGRAGRGPRADKNRAREGFAGWPGRGLPSPAVAACRGLPALRCDSSSGRAAQQLLPHGTSLPPCHQSPARGAPPPGALYSTWPAAAASNSLPRACAWARLPRNRSCACRAGRRLPLPGRL